MAEKEGNKGLRSKIPIKAQHIVIWREKLAHPRSKNIILMKVWWTPYCFARSTVTVIE